MSGERPHSDQFIALDLIDKDGDLQEHPADDYAIPKLFGWMQKGRLIKRYGQRWYLTDAGRAALARHDKGTGQEEGTDG